MDQINFKLEGKTPFLMHNNRTVNPMDCYTIAIGKVSGKRKKTLDDHARLARLEWEASLYLEGNEVKIPMRLVNKCFENGAKKKKNGPLWKTGCMILDDFCDFTYKGPKLQVTQKKEIPNPELDKFFDIYSNQAVVRVGSASILRTRPIFYDWTIQVGVAFDPAIIDRETLIQVAEDAGYLVGLGDWRIEKGGSYGRFKVETF